MAVNNPSGDKSERWYFTKEHLENTPSRKAAIDAYKELSYRQQAANFIQDMGQRLKVSQLCINTAIVYMHRFYVFHSFSNFPWHQMAAAALFLAAKVEEQPRKLEYVIRIANICRNPKDTSIDVNSERYQAQSQDLVFNENVLLQTLGFDVAIDHPHTHVVRCCHLVRASKDLAQTSYFMASNSLHLTTMCLQYKPTVVACFCIHVACKWSNWEIPLSNEDKEWFSYVDPTVTAELLQQLTKEFLVIFESCPSRLKEKIMAIADTNSISHNTGPNINSPFDTDPRKIVSHEQKDSHSHRSQHDVKQGESDPHKHRSSRPHESSSGNQQPRERDREREYREKKERERLAQQHGGKPLLPGSQPGTKPVVPHGHHRSHIDPKLKSHTRPPVAPYPPTSRAEPRDILREAAKDSPFGIASKEFKEREHKDLSVRSDKEVQKRDYLLKTNVTESNSLTNYPDARVNYSSGDRVRMDSNRPPRPNDPNKLPYKHDSVRRHEESKTYLKSETDNIKKHLNSVHEKSSAYLMKHTSSTSQKTKSPFDTDTSKSVPKPSSSQPNIKSHQQNGSSSSSLYGLPLFDAKIKPDAYIKEEPHVKEEHTFKEEPYFKESGHLKIELPVKEEHYSKAEIPIIKEEKVDLYQPPVKRQSLFSPEKSPPQKIQSSSIKQEIKMSYKKIPDMTSPIVPVPSVMSPVESPGSDKRSRAYSSSSEPELRPVMTKIDQVEGFETLVHDTSIGINKLQKMPNMLTHSDVRRESTSQYCNDMKSNSSMISSGNSDSGIGSQGLINGIETNPTLISHLLKETPPVLASTVGNPSVVAAPVSETVEPQPVIKEKERDHHHHKSKKKNKEKHKHKDKDKNREEREKKKKHKDKDREKHKHRDKHDIPPQPIVTEPIKIKIQKDKIQPIPPAPPAETLKIRIPKDKIKTDGIGKPSSYPAIPTGGLKLKIPKDVINNCTVSTDIGSNNSGSSSSRKRDRDRSSPGETPPNKIAKTSHRDSKQNGRHSYSKVSDYTIQNMCRYMGGFPPSRVVSNVPPPIHMLGPPPCSTIPFRPIRPPPIRPPMYYYRPPDRLIRPPHNMNILNMPNMSVPPPNFMYPETQMCPQYYPPYMYANPPGLYQQRLPLFHVTNSNPPLPADAPPDARPPPPPPE